MVKGMSTLVEIEAAIDKLPAAQRRELVERLEESLDLEEFSLEAARQVFQMYDREEEEMDQMRREGKNS